jgi:hypothetical protein
MNVNPAKTKGVKHLGEVDISEIREEILAIPEEIWDQQNQQKPNKFHELKDTKHIVFRFVYDLNDCTRYFEFPIWEEWKSKIMPLLNKAVQPYGYEQGIFSRIMLAKLKAGGMIQAHIDGIAAATFPHKIHIPIQTNEKVSFFVNPTTYHFKTGNVYEVNNYALHFVENEGDEDRIHLIAEYFNPEHLPKNISFVLQAYQDI